MNISIFYVHVLSMDALQDLFSVFFSVYMVCVIKRYLLYKKCVCVRSVKK